MKFLILLFIFSLNYNAFAAKIIERKSPITNVTVFKDRAFVKRRQVVKLKKGSYSLLFKELTPSLDKNSLKVKVSDQKFVEVLGVRTKDKYLKKSENKELNQHQDKKRTLEKEIRNINLKVSNLIKEHKDLRIITDHYNDSFTLNLHSKKWSKDRFVSFLGFLEKRSQKMFNKWKSSFLSFIKLYDDLQFTNQKIYQLSSVSDTHKLDVFVDVTIPTDVESAWVEVHYLVHNTGWNPVYDIRVNSKKKSATIEQHAMVWQKTGEVWKNVKLRLSNVRSELNPKIPSISSYTLSFQEVKKVKTSIKNQMEEVADLSQGSSAHSYVEGMAKYFDIKKKQTILNKMPQTKIFIQQSTSPYSEHLELVANQYPHVYRKGELKNTFSFTLYQGPLGLYYNGEFIQNSMLKTTVKDKKFFLNAGIDYSIKVDRWHKNKKEKSGLINQNREFKRDFITSLKNYSSRPKSIKVLEQVPFSELKEITVTREGSTKGLQKIEEFPSWHYWSLKLKPQEKKSVTLSLSVTTPKDFSFSWP